MDLFLSFNDDAGLVADLGSGGGRPLRPGQYFSIFKMLDGRTPRGSPSRETIFYPSIVCRYIRAYIPTYTIECELIFYQNNTVNEQ